MSNHSAKTPVQIALPGVWGLSSVRVSAHLTVRLNPYKASNTVLCHRYYTTSKQPVKNYAQITAREISEPSQQSRIVASSRA